MTADTTGKRNFTSMAELQEYLQDYAEARDWQKFHSPKNLVMALSVEVSELLEHFQWLTETQSKRLPAAAKQAVSHEMADVLLYLLRLSQVLEIDLYQACAEKTALNEQRYPAAKVKGSAKKYTDY